MKKACIFLFMTFALSFAGASEHEHGFEWSELRLFGENTKLSNSQTALNNLTAADQVSSLSSLTSYGIEADAHLGSWLKIGSRFHGTWTSLSSSASSTAGLTVRQNAASLLLRVPFIEADYLTFDIFGEAGVANSEIDVRTSSSGTGAFTQNSSLFQRVGGSVGFGGKEVKLFVEAGQEWNNLNNLTYQGTLSTNITSANMNGTFIGGGLIISGVPSWIKPGGFSTR